MHGRAYQMKSWIFFVIISALLTACAGVDEVPITDWAHHSDFPGVPRASASTFVIGTKAYVCCGRTSAPSNEYWQYDSIAHKWTKVSTPTKELWQYDSSTDSWTQLDPFPGKPRVKALAVTINGKAYVGMGSNGYAYTNSVFNDFYEYNPTSGTWTSKAPFPGNASNDLAYAVVNGCLYTAMGFTGIQRSNDTYKYDPVTDVWTKLEDCQGSYSATSFFSIGQNFYVVSGYQGRNIRTAFRFDTQSEKWLTAPSLPDGRMMSNGLAINDKGYVMLGRFWNGAENGGRLLSDIVEYDPLVNTWTKRGDFPGGALQNAMVLTIQGRGYIIMGENDSRLLSDVWSFKP